MDQLVDEILLASRLTSVAQNDAREEVDLLALAAEEGARYDDVHLEGDALARVNRSLFGRACTNLLMNAIQHCEPGASISVKIARGEGPMHDQLRVSVANPGAPIAPDVAE